MTDRALDAFTRIRDHVIAYVEDGDWPDSEAAQIDVDLQTLRTSLSNAQEVVTVDTLIAKIKRKHKLKSNAACITFAKALLLELHEEYPNGLKITAAPNGGGE